MDKNLNVAHVIVNNLGGITTLIQNLLLFKEEDALPQELVVLKIEGSKYAPAFIDEKLNKIVSSYKIYPKDNWYHVYKKLAHQLNLSKGVLISNDQYDLTMLRAFNIDRKVIQIVHDEYNLDLSIKFEDCIDSFIAHSKYIFEQLKEKLPHRLSDINLIHYGIPISKIQNNLENKSDSLKLLFLGRHVKDKGIFDIYEINEILKKKNIKVDWTILGKGPETENVKKQWADEKNASFLIPASHEEVMNIISKNDILVFPTKFEGFPVAILESLSRGCVPISSDIVGGIQEVVINNKTGFKCEINNNNSFVDKIEFLDQNRELLFVMKKNGIELTANEYNVINQSKKYQDFFKTIANSNTQPLHHLVNKKIGSRLDQNYIPNFITRYLRKVLKIVAPQ